jgi:hypothetical protein
MLSRWGTISLIYIARFFSFFDALAKRDREKHKCSFLSECLVSKLLRTGKGKRDALTVIVTPTSRFHEHITSWGCWRFALSSPFSPFVSLHLGAVPIQMANFARFANTDINP